MDKEHAHLLRMYAYACMWTVAHMIALSTFARRRHHHVNYLKGYDFPFAAADQFRTARPTPPCLNIKMYLACYSYVCCCHSRTYAYMSPPTYMIQLATLKSAFASERGAFFACIGSRKSSGPLRIIRECFNNTNQLVDHTISPPSKASLTKRWVCMNTVPEKKFTS